MDTCDLMVSETTWPDFVTIAHAVSSQDVSMPKMKAFLPPFNWMAFLRNIFSSLVS